jgi:DNA-binding PadR family transcriptional regulator
VKKFKEKIDLYKETRFMSHFFKGMSHFFMIWTISKGKIHGYGLMNKLNESFSEEIEEGIIKKFTPSKIYPLLHKMEKKGLIVGEWENDNNKNVKFYELTEKGEQLFDTIKNNFKKINENPNLKEFFEDFTGFKYEK